MSVPTPPSPPPAAGGGDPITTIMITLSKMEGMLGVILPQHTSEIEALRADTAQLGSDLQDVRTKVALLQQSQTSHDQQAPKRWQAASSWASVVSAVIALAALVVAIWH